MNDNEPFQHEATNKAWQRYQSKPAAGDLFPAADAFRAGWNARADFIEARVQLKHEASGGCGFLLAMIGAICGGTLALLTILWAFEDMGFDHPRVFALLAGCAVLVLIGKRLMRREQAEYAEAKADFVERWGQP